MYETKIFEDEMSEIEMTEDEVSNVEMSEVESPIMKSLKMILVRGIL